MQAQELIHQFERFFQQKDHRQIKPAQLATGPKETTLFISAGMQPLIPYLSGQPHPAGRRLFNCQPCLRTGDIDAVGDTSHLTVFEMLGNWSLGAYFKAESISMSYEFLTEWLHLDPARLWVTVFAGDVDAPADEESPRIWQSLGLPEARIVPLGREDNWWGPVGDTGPCGPDTEIFFDLGEPGCGPDCKPGCDCGRFIEIWNNVFMTYHRTHDGRYEPLPQQSVDTGMGVDRMAMVLQDHASVFESELYAPIIQQLLSLTPEPAPPTKSIRVIADHLKAATFILAEGIRPANKRQGYVARRLIRRAVDHGRRLGIEGSFTADVAETVGQIYAGRYPQLSANSPFIREALQTEEQLFNRTLRRGRRIFDDYLTELQQRGERRLSGGRVFQLFDTYGIPPELSSEWAEAAGLTIDQAGFEQAMAKHREVSGGGKSGEFSGGLAARDPQSIRLHTATHLLHQALRNILGDHVAQKGSHITPERLRFDFSHPAKLSPAEIAQIEAEVNAQIKANLPIHWAEMGLAEAQAQGAIGLFGEKYGEQVKVYAIGEYSREICGGPHVQQTGELGHFRILREQSNGAGVRRIRATVGAG